jgi:hypothetical protein
MKVYSYFKIKSLGYFQPTEMIPFVVSTLHREEEKAVDVFKEKSL